MSIRESISSLTDAAWQGGLLAVLVLLFFLRNLRSVGIVAVSIPVSVIATFLLMDLAGIDLNIMSLAGLTLGVGMFVDNSIVVLEVVFRKQLAGLPPREAAIAGAAEVTTAVVASTLTNVVVFLPLVFVTGLANIIMRDLAYTLSFSMMMSLAMALALVPVLCARFQRLPAGRRHPPAGPARGEGRPRDQPRGRPAAHRQPGRGRGRGRVPAHHPVARRELRAGPRLGPAPLGVGARHAPRCCWPRAWPRSCCWAWSSCPRPTRDA